MEPRAGGHGHVGLSQRLRSLLLEGQRLNSAEPQGSGQGPAGFLPCATGMALTLRTVPEHGELLCSAVLKHKQRGRWGRGGRGCHKRVQALFPAAPTSLSRASRSGICPVAACHGLAGTLLGRVRV